MPRGVKKENLPTKVCVVCNRPFTWRKKWEKVWDEVSTCSKSCNRKRKQEKNTQRYMLKSESRKDGECVGHHCENSLNCSYEGDTDFEITPAMCEKDDITKASTSSSTRHDFISSGCIDDLSAPIDLLNQLQVDDESFGNDSNSNASEEELVSIIDDPVALRKAQRKAEKKRKKQERRAQREGRGDPTAGQKQCDMCSKSVDLLIRCTYDESQDWKMVCGKCWKIASGGVVDGDGSHPHYKYGGLWKNRRKK